MARRMSAILGVVLATVLVGTTCGGQRASRSNTCELHLSDAGPKLEWVTDVPNCVEPPSSPWSARVQLLIDNSGSMNGFKGVMPTVQLWMRQGLSSLMGSFVRLHNPSRGCYFNQKTGIGQCIGLAAGFDSPFRPFRTEGDTNFHAAILSAKEYDLSLIVTDGVDFTGSGNGDCAGGVDAACVANSLMEVMEVYGLTGAPDAGGAWIIPLASEFDGTYFSEQHIPPEDFKSFDVIQTTRNEVKQDVRIEKMRQEKNGDLIYNYHGPREWFLLVIARPAVLGRAAVNGLWQKVGMPDVHSLTSISDLKDGLGVFKPVEVFPGYLPPGKLGALHPLGMEQDVTGKTECPPIEVGWWRENAVVKLNSVVHGEALRRLTMSRENSPAKCSPLGMAMPFQMWLEKRGGGAPPNSIHAYSLSWNKASLDVHLVADKSSTLPTCGKADSLDVLWTAQPNFGDAADCLVTDSCTSGYTGMLRQIDATDPASQPHRVFGLVPTLKMFWNQAGKKSQKSSLAELGLCQ